MSKCFYSQLSDMVHRPFVILMVLLIWFHHDQISYKPPSLSYFIKQVHSPIKWKESSNWYCIGVLRQEVIVKSLITKMPLRHIGLLFYQLVIYSVYYAFCVGGGGQMGKIRTSGYFSVYNNRFICQSNSANLFFFHIFSQKVG